LSPSGAWASGAIVSTPADLGAFIRAELGGRFFDRAQRVAQMRFVAGASSRPGPGRNTAGLAIFRYQTRCGTVYGHTGDFPGYVQWIAATADGRRRSSSRDALTACLLFRARTRAAGLGRLPAVRSGREGFRGRKRGEQLLGRRFDDDAVVRLDGL
jgi:Beta-lactamase